MRRRLWSLPVLLLCAAAFAALALGSSALLHRRSESAAGSPAHSAPLPAQTAPVPTAEPLPAALFALRITELMPNNESGDGDFRDWVEITNTGSETAELGGCFLSDREDEPRRFRFPSLSLAPGERVVVYADPNGVGELCAPFALSAQGESLFLFAPDATPLQQVSWGETGKNTSVCFDGEGGGVLSRFPTPGRENSRQAYRALCAESARDSELLINEAVSAGSALEYGGQARDWAELKNASSQPLSLSGWSLTDDADEPGKFPLPDVTLAPGALYVLLCDRDTAAGGNDYVSSGFALDGTEDELYLFDAQGVCRDWALLRGLPIGGSLGRLPGENGFFCLAAPSPGQENGGSAARYVSDAPAAELASGCYDGVESMTVALSSPGRVYYTTDGSAPGENSALYTGPLTLQSSAVIRAFAAEDEGLPSGEASFHYILNQNDTLPVLSLAADPDGFWGEEGLYPNSNKELELPGCAALLEEGGGFALGCGLSLHGNSGIDSKHGQKGMNIRFRARYGDGALLYDLFGDGVETYDSLVLRTGRSRESYYIADPLYSQLARESVTALNTQRCRLVSVYLNGQFLGLFQLRDRYCPAYFAQLWDVSRESVEIVSIADMGGTEFKRLLQRIRATDFSQSGAYEEIAAQLDVESLAEWCVIEAYSGNVDLRTNVKFVRSAQYDGKWHILLYDMDRAMFVSGGLDNFMRSYSGTDFTFLRAIRALFRAPDFQTLMVEKLSAMLGSSLTTEHTLAVLDQLQAQADATLRRGIVRWGGDVSAYERGIASLRTAIVERDIPRVMIESADEIFSLTDEARQRLLAALPQG